jgi:hypothetical protein
MKQLTKTSLFLALMMLLTLSSCQKNEVTDLTISKSAITLKVGLSDTLVTTASWSGDISKQPMTLTSSDTTIATVKEIAPKDVSINKAGSFTKSIAIKARKAGTTNVTVEVGGKTAICQITVSQTNLSFSQIFASNWSDYYDVGTNNFTFHLLENTLQVDTAGKIHGIGNLLFIDFNVPITQNTIAEGYFTASNKFEANTFLPSEISNNQIYGSYIKTFGKDSITTTLVQDGHYSITAVGKNYRIDGELITTKNEVIHFSYSGSIPLANREIPVEITPDFTQGRLYYYGDTYKSGTSNNFTAYLATKDVNFADSIINGEILMLEINTALTATDSIPSGKYSMMPDLLTANLIPKSIVPGYTTNNGNNWGSWYYGQTTKKLKTGDVVVSKSGDQYTINYQLSDRFGSKVSGIFTGPLSYYNGTTGSGVAPAKVKGSTKLKSLIDRQILNKKIKPNIFKY